MTLRTLSLGAADATTGWYLPTYTPSTINAFIVFRGLQRFLLSPGYFTNHEATALSRTKMTDGDELEDKNNNFFKVLRTRKHTALDQTFFYQADLALMPVHPSRAAETPPTKMSGRYDFFKQIVSNWQRMLPGASPDVTLYSLVLSATRDADTGWYQPSWTQSTIHMIVLPA